MRRTLISTLFAAALALPAGAFASWTLWDDFKASNVESSRVVDYSDERRITTSEGQSYALFFALVAEDRKSFDALLKWTESNLSSGDFARRLPAWLWGRRDSGVWGVIDSNNASDSDLWIAYCLLEAARLWGEEGYREKALKLLTLLKKEVRDVPNLGRVVLPGHSGFEQNGTVKLNPSYYPLFIFKRFALEDPYWMSVYEGSLRSLLRSAPCGVAPEWAKFDRNGRLVTPEGDDLETGSWNAIRTYLWAGMLSPEDPARRLLVRQFAPMAELTSKLNMPPETVHAVTLAVNRPGNAGFAACLLPMLEEGPAARYIRTVLAGSGVHRDSYYTNTLILFGRGYEEGRYRFDAQGRLVLHGGIE